MNDTVTGSARAAHPSPAVARAMLGLWLAGAPFLSPEPAVAAEPGSARASTTSAGSAASADLQARLAELERQVAELTRQLAAARAAGAPLPPERLSELERRIDVLASEIERLRSGTAGEDSPMTSTRGLGPAASKVYGRDRGVSIGGYGEALYQNFEALADDGSPAGAGESLDLVRAVLYFGYKFDKGIVFNSEIEYEHATTGEGDEEKGEVSVEFAYLDFPLTPSLGVRAGQMLVPVGFVNELHEPPIFLGARRPDVERFIVPTTWREVGAGLYGDAGPVSWRAYLQASLDASGFAANGIRDGRQGGSESNAQDLALVGRVDWTIVPGLTAGGSCFAGDAGQGLEDAAGRPIEARTRLVELHADWRARGWQARALYARGRVSDVARLNDALGYTAEASIGERNHGWYTEVGLDVLRAPEAASASLVPFLRFERYDTQDQVPVGFARDPALRVRVVTAGLAYKPIPSVVVKGDYQDYENGARTGLDRFNVALGYLF